MPTKAQETLKELARLLKIEKEEDYAQYQRKMLNTSIQERKKQGVTWYPVQLVNRFISTGERLTLELDRTSDPEQNHSFQTGAIVSVFSGHGEEAFAISGVISYLRKEKMRVVLNTAELADWLKEGKLGVNLLFDEGSYKEMDRALREVTAAEKGNCRLTRDVLWRLACQF